MKFEGIYTPVLTPYDDNHAINFDAIEPIIEDLINSGVHGIVVAGTTGEYYAQDTKERLQVMKISKDIINNRVPCIVGTGAIRTEDSVFFAEEAAKIGADGILIATPHTRSQRKEKMHFMHSQLIGPPIFQLCFITIPEEWAQ